jgi:hypothetical protein
MGSWLPTWLSALWASLFVVVLVVHAGHLQRVSGWGRLWHSGHVVMALGMADMYWPHQPPPVTGRLGEIAFVILTAAAVAMVAWTATRGRVSWAWAIGAVDFAIMAYMFAMSDHRSVSLTVALTVWLVLEAVGWSAGWLSALADAEDLGRHDHPRGPHHELPEPPDAAAGATAGRWPWPRTRTVAQPVQARPTTTRAPVTTRPGHDGGGHWTSVRVTLTVMSLGMAYMLLVMQFGMSMTPAGPGSMPGM